MTANSITGIRRSNRVGEQFRLDVVAYLKAGGLPARTRPARKPSEPVAPPTGDILGIPGWTLVCNRRTEFEPSRSLHAADAAQQAQESRFSAVVAFRKGADFEDSYVLMPLHQFRDLLREAS